ncbi:MAG: group 1 glycosyl transferase [Puniceicoccaceae bacterium 5H]|nr:MAG: group 1 glycosyl transferase [Puniceicoccaceae bacterium 5H]
MIPYFVSDNYTRSELSPKGGEEPYISFIGLLYDHRKGVDLLLQALKLLKDRGKNYRLKLIGEGRLRGEYEAYAEEHQLKVEFLGKVSEEENYQIVARSRLFVGPSRAESFGIVYIESLCAGTPVIGFAPTVRELQALIDPSVGTPFDPERQDTHLLAAEIENWMEEKADAFEVRREELAKGTHALYSRQAYREQYAKLYSKLCGL